VNKLPKSSNPSVTIITATYNASEYLARTINSVRNLTYDNVEWIIVDGGSTDGTIELIKQNEDVIDYWVSEADRGIYDAWNKGILLAKGDWISFIGAGDCYIPEAIDIYINAIRVSVSTPELASSRVRFVDRDGVTLRFYGEPFHWGRFRKYMTIAHVGALHNKVLFEKYGFFDMAYSSSADYEFFMRCGGDLKTLFLDVVTADMLAGGICNGYKSLHETYLVQRKYNLGILAMYAYLIACSKRFFSRLLRGY
jgi:glycosyltransferase involved in cell wall biosynthesis